MISIYKLKLFKILHMPNIFDARLLIDEINPEKTVEEIVDSIEKKSGKKFHHHVVHKDVVQMVGNIFNFFNYSENELKSELIRSSNIVSKIK